MGWPYHALVAAAALAWLVYSFSGTRPPGWMAASGVILLVLLVPLLRKQ